jgi:hypothetical protein
MLEEEEEEDVVVVEEEEEEGGGIARESFRVKFRQTFFNPLTYFRIFNTFQ